jgi:DNA-directed RNA polymerase specialized sigma24 family protein
VSLTPRSFDRLLEALDSDRERAGQCYVQIRRKLVKFFEWHGCACPDDLADRTIDRVCRKVEEGQTIRAAEPSAYFHGVARNILREHWVENRKEAAMLRGFAPVADETARGQAQPAASESFEADRRLRCLQTCLQMLFPESRDLILRYYEGPSEARIGNRKALSELLGIPLNALRIRSYRLRARLESCVEKCLKEKGGEMDTDFSHKKSREQN